LGGVGGGEGKEKKVRLGWNARRDKPTTLVTHKIETQTSFWDPGGRRVKAGHGPTNERGKRLSVSKRKRKKNAKLLAEKRSVIKGKTKH